MCGYLMEMYGTTEILLKMCGTNGFLMKYVQYNWITIPNEICAVQLDSYYCVVMKYVQSN